MRVFHRICIGWDGWKGGGKGDVVRENGWLLGRVCGKMIISY